MVKNSFRARSNKKYIVAFFITSLVFALGLSVGLVVDNERVRSIENQNKMQNLDYDSMQFQYLFMNTLNSSAEACIVLESTLENIIKDLSESLADIEAYNEESDFNKDKFDLLSRQYTLDNLRYWLFAEQAKKDCGLDIVTVLYFFDDKCTECNIQGTILTFYKKQLDKQLLIFPLDLNNEEEERSLLVLKARYNITSVPSLVINDKVYQGVISKKNFANIICHDYVEKPDFCEVENEEE